MGESNSTAVAAILLCGVYMALLLMVLYLTVRYKQHR